MVYHMSILEQTVMGKQYNWDGSSAARKDVSDLSLQDAAGAATCASGKGLERTAHLEESVLVRR